ncbi:MAG: TonB-dependent receptor [Gammaproteobacteria bacterium]|jgi:Fe(3+) dicitrate transport protein|nr:TonB-dependent receptor [Gammaproteobacteria bacterium]|tara:strand:- start:1941 stop:4094 length:2154 start_codon:yes stop_codon:yes gene_type:complete
MIKKLTSTLFFFSVFQMCNASGANNDLAEIVVVGSMSDVSTVPGSGIAIDLEQLERFDYIDLHQVLSSVPGVYVREEDGYGLRPNIGIRGAVAERSQKITIMEDGILITPAPYSAPAAYYVPNISRMQAVEVLKGPSAIRHGPHTVGGAINLVTADVRPSRFAEIDVSYGSEAFYQLQGIYSDEFKDTDFSLDFATLGTDGFKSLDGGGGTGFVKNEVNLKVQREFNGKRDHVLSFKAGWADEDADETYLGLSDEDFETNPVRRYRASQLAKFKSDHTTLHLIHGVQWNNALRINTKAYWHRFNREWNKLDGFIEGPTLQSVLANPELFVSQYQLIKGERNSAETDADTLDVTNNDRSFTSSGVQVTAHYEFETGALDHQLSSGLRYHFDEVDREHRLAGYLMANGIMNVDGKTRDPKVFNHAETEAWSLFVEDEIMIGSLTVNIGGRFEDIQGELDNKLAVLETNNDQDSMTLGAGAHWQVTDSIGLLVGAYEGFSPAAPGSGAEPEETTNYEYGARYDGGMGRLEIIGFFSDYGNLLGRCRVSDAGCNPGQEFNGGSVEIAGAELTGSRSFAINEGLALEVSLVYTYTESAFQESFFSQFSQWGLVRKGDALPYLPAHRGQLQVGLVADRWRVWTSVNAQSQMREEAGKGDVDLGLHADRFTTVDVSGVWVIDEHWEAQFRVKNVLDESAVVSHRPYGARPNRTRSVMGSIKYIF